MRLRQVAARICVVMLAFAELGNAVGGLESGVSGAVIDAESGVPIVANISVADTQLPEMRFSDVRTNSEGAFEVLGLRPGKKILIVRAEGYGFSWKEVILEAGYILSEVNFALERSATLEGMVTDESGVPLEGVVVRLLYSDLPSVVYQYMVGWAETDENGTFKTREVAPSRDLLIELTHPEFQPAWADHAIRLFPTQFYRTSPYQLRAGVRISGNVLDTEGGPLSGVEIRLIPIRLRQSPPPSFNREVSAMADRWIVKTASDGSFDLDAVPEGRFRLIARSTEHRLYHRVIHVGATAAQPLALEIKLLPVGL